MIYTDASFATGLARSTDSGASWTDLTSLLPPPQNFGHYPGALTLDPSNPQILWLSDLFNDAVYRSNDGGAHWQETHFPSPLSPSLSLAKNPDNSGIVVDPTNSLRVYVCCSYAGPYTPPAIYRTDDGGATWTKGGPGLGNCIGPPVADPRKPLSLYAPWCDGLMRSTDGGQSWQALPVPQSPAGSSFGSGSVGIDNSGVLSLVNGAGLLLRSTDGGATWVMHTGPWSQPARVLAIDAANPSTIYVSSPGSSQHAFVAKLDPSGATLWATLLGGSQADEADALALDDAGNVYVAGRTQSFDFPIVNALQAATSGYNFDGFAAKISSDGARLLYSTYLGGSGVDAVRALTVDTGGNAYLAGSTNSVDFPVANPLQAKPGSPYGSSFVSKLDPTGQRLLFSTFLGGSLGYPFDDTANSIGIDAQGNLWVAGSTGTIDFPLVRPIQPSTGAGYLAQITPGGVLLFSTYLPYTITSLTPAPGSVLLAGGNEVARLDLALPAPPPGMPRVDAVYNGASWELRDMVSPGEIVSLMGAELAPAPQDAAGYPLPKTLQNVSVTVGGFAAPLFYVSPGQINLQVPMELAPGGAGLVVTRNGQSTARPVKVVALTPGVFIFNGSSGQPSVTHASDFSLVTQRNPAHAGEYLSVFCTGLGATTPTVNSGDAAPPGVSSQALVGIQLDVGSPEVSYAGLAPGFAGLYQIDFRLPDDEPAGTRVLWIYPRQGGSSNGVSFPVQ